MFFRNFFYYQSLKKDTKVNPRLRRGCSGDHRQGLRPLPGLPRSDTAREPGRFPHMRDRLPQLRDKSWSCMSNHMRVSPMMVITQATTDRVYDHCRGCLDQTPE